MRMAMRSSEVPMVPKAMVWSPVLSGAWRAIVSGMMLPG